MKKSTFFYVKETVNSVIATIKFYTLFYFGVIIYVDWGEKRMKLKDKHSFYLILLFVVSFLILLPLFLRPYYAGHDTKFHIANILSIMDQIKMGNIPTSPILGKIGYGLGYGTRLFYPPLAHTITAYIAYFLSNFHIGVLTSIQFVHFLVLFLSGISMYFLSYRLSNNKKIAFFSAIIYMSFPYHISDIYVRDSLAECFIFIFLPMIFSGVLELLRGNKAKFYLLFVVGYVGGIYSHLTLMLYFTVLLLIFLLCSGKKVLKKEVMIPFIFATLLVLGITSMFLVNVIQNHTVGNYVVFEPGEMTKRISKTALYPFEYFNIIPSLQSGIKHYFPVVVLLLLFFTFTKRKEISMKYSKNFLVVLFVSFLLSTKLFPWKFVPHFFQMIQFPWRMQIFVGLVISLFAPLCLLKLKNKKLSIFLILCLLLSSYIAIDIPCEEVIDIDNVWWNGGMGWQKEYLPIVAKQNKDYIKKKKQTISFVVGEGSYKIIENEIPNLTFEIKSENASVLELPRIYYPGYYLIDSKGQKQEASMSPYGLLEVRISNSGVYHLEYNGTHIVRISKIISILSILSFLFIYFFFRKKESTMVN